MNKALACCWRTNLTLFWLTLVVLALQLAVIYLTPIAGFFHATPLTPTQLLLTIALGTLAFWVIELEKWWERKK